MKIKNLFLAGLITVSVMTACSNDDRGNGKNPAGDEGNTYMTLRLTGEPDAGYNAPGFSRAENGLDKKNGTNGENAITDAIVLLTDGNGKVIKTVMPALSVTGTGAYTEPFQVSTGTYYVYVIANPTAELKAWSEDESVGDRTINDIDAIAMSDKYAKDGTFLMFNESRGTDDVQGQKIVVTEANTFKNPAMGEGPIKLDRLAVKIVSTGKNVKFSEFKQKLKDIDDVRMEGYVLVNGIYRSFLQQHWSGPKTSTYPYRNDLITPDVDLSYFYATLEDYAYIDYFDAIRDMSKEMQMVFDADPLYCMENNSEPGNWIGYVGIGTGILYRWQVTNEESDGYAGENSFYCYNNEYFSTLKDMQDAYHGVFNDNGEEHDDEITLKHELDAAQEQLTRDPAIFRVRYNVKVYQDGTMYYTHYIKDQNHVDEFGDPYYAVMRNTIYELNVISLLDIGDDIPGGWNPDWETPDPATGTYMEVEVKVNKWGLSSQDIEL